MNLLLILEKTFANLGYNIIMSHCALASAVLCILRDGLYLKLTSLLEQAIPANNRLRLPWFILAAAEDEGRTNYQRNGGARKNVKKVVYRKVPRSQRP